MASIVLHEVTHEWAPHGAKGNTDPFGFALTVNAGVVLGNKKIREIIDELEAFLSADVLTELHADAAALEKGAGGARDLYRDVTASVAAPEAGPAGGGTPAAPTAGTRDGRGGDVPQRPGGTPQGLAARAEPEGAAGDAGRGQGPESGLGRDLPDDLRELYARRPKNQPPRISVAPLPGGTVRRPRDIVKDLSRSLGKRYVKAVLRRNTLGSYFPGGSGIKIKLFGDLDTVAHETGHLLDDRFGILKSWAQARTRSPFDAELATFWWYYPGQKNLSLARRRAEGLAEWLRGWIVNPQQAEAQAPGFTRFFYSKVSDEVLDVLRRYSEDVRT